MLLLMLYSLLVVLLTQLLISSATVLLTKGGLVVRTATATDIPRAGNFLAGWMYPEDVPRGQRAELARLEASDLSKRYGERLKPRYPSALLLAEIDEEIVGCAGVDAQVGGHTPYTFHHRK